jgi:ABC-type molybdate transport system permease subunit
MLFAQSLGEYGAGGIVAQIGTTIESAARWLQRSLQEDRAAWIVAALCVVLGMWLFRRR